MAINLRDNLIKKKCSNLKDLIYEYSEQLLKTIFLLLLSVYLFFYCFSTVGGTDGTVGGIFLAFIILFLIMTVW
jgi:uncharacterized membrane protein